MSRIPTPITARLNQPVTNTYVHRLTCIVLLAVLFTSTPGAAAHDSLACTPPADLQPLFELLDAITQVAFIFGVGLGTLGFVTAGLMIAAPFGEDWNRRGKEVAKAVLFGVILLMSSNMIMSFLVSQLGGVFC